VPEVECLNAFFSPVSGLDAYYAALAEDDTCTRDVTADAADCRSALNALSLLWTSVRVHVDTLDNGIQLMEVQRQMCNVDGVCNENRVCIKVPRIVNISLHTEIHSSRLFVAFRSQGCSTTYVYSVQ
jgi:hypothetical protein